MLRFNLQAFLELYAIDSDCLHNSNTNGSAVTLTGVLMQQGESYEVGIFSPQDVSQ